MEKITIPDGLWTEVEKQLEAIDSARTGLDHFSGVLKAGHDRLWEIIYTEMPDLNDYNLRVDRPTKTVIKLRIK